MPPVIPSFTPAQVSQTPAAKPAAEARAAQRAFFQQALGDTTPASAATAVQPARPRGVEAAVTRVTTQPIPDEKPEGYRRPGSFVDIKV